MKDFLKRHSVPLELTLVFVVCAALWYSGYWMGERNERSEETDVGVLIAKADSNIVSLQQIANQVPKTSQDSVRVNRAGLNVIYWRAVKDAFLSLDESSIRVKKSTFGK